MRARIAAAVAAVGAALVALALAAGGSPPAPLVISRVPPVKRVTDGPRGGTIWLARGGRIALYLPRRQPSGTRLGVVVVHAPTAPADFAAQARLGDVGDYLVWNGDAPPFAAVVVGPAQVVPSGGWLHVLAHGLTLARGGDRIFLSVHGPVRTLDASSGEQPAILRTALVREVASRAALQSAAMARKVAPRGWVRIDVGPNGGTVWRGTIPSTLPGVRPRSTLVYLPPDPVASERYPEVVLLHGLRGSPYSFIGGLRIAAVADGMIHRRRVLPFVAVMPPAGATVSFDGEWTGGWEDYVVDDVVPWATRHLPVSSAASMRSLAGLSAGGYGAVDIGLRHPGLACALESWSGYFRTPKDGSLRGATLAVRLEHDPGELVRKEASQLARRGTRFFVSAGRGDGAARRGALRFVALLRRIHLPYRLVLLPGSHDARVWRGQLPAALRFAVRTGRPVRTAPRPAAP